MATKKLPHIPFYVGDWSKDPAVKCANVMQKGIWFELILILWECPKRGYLAKRSGKPYTEDEVCRMIGITLDEWQEWQELELHSVTPEGVIYSEWIAEHQRISELRKQAGSKGGSSKNKQSSKLEAKHKQSTDNDNDNDSNSINDKPVMKKSEELFEKFWSAYPSKSGKANALKDWLKNKCHLEYEKIISDVELKKLHKWDMGKDYGKEFRSKPPNGSTYVHQQRWNDDWQPDQQKKTFDPAKQAKQKEYESVKRQIQEIESGRVEGVSVSSLRIELNTLAQEMGIQP